MPSDEDIDYIEVEGVVSRIAGHGFYEVRVGEKTLLATLCGKMRINRITVLPDDLVTCRVSMYSLDRAIIRFRHLARVGDRV